MKEKQGILKEKKEWYSPSFSKLKVVQTFGGTEKAYESNQGAIASHG